MNSRILLLLALATMLSNADAQTSAPPVRVAIVAADPSLAAAADQLTVTLSKIGRVELLERAQIEKIFHEQALAATRPDYVKIGQLLGADGLLVLTSLAEGTNQFLQSRMVAVKPAVVIDSLRVPLAEKPERWQRVVAERLTLLLPKFTVLAKDAVPVSVLNFRSAVRGANQSVEREFTVLLIHRLVRERELFVLERQSLGEARFEKELQSDESPFWTGRYLLDGILDRTGFDPNRLTISARLVSPLGAPTPLELSGSRADLAEVVELVVSNVLTALHRNSEAREWRPAEEASHYAEEAEWALRWGLIPEARSASESAWALGRRTKQVALARVRSWTEGVPTEFWSTSSRLDDLPPAPDSGRLAPAIRALELFGDNTSHFAMSNGVPDADWLQAGFDALDQASGLLENYHRVAEARELAGAQLTDLRAAARRAAASVPANLYSNTPTGFSKWNWQLQRMDRWYRLRWNWGGLWYEKPGEALPMFTQNLVEGWHVSSRLSSPPGSPRLIAWSWADRRRIPALQQQFLEQLRHSPDAGLRLDGCFLAIHEKKARGTRDELNDAVQVWADELWAQRESLYDGRLDDGSGSAIMNVQRLVRDKFDVNDLLAATQEPFASSVMRLRKDYLLNHRNFVRAGFYSVFLNHDRDVYTPEMAGELAPLLREFSDRLRLSAADEDLVRGKATTLAAMAAKTNAAPVIAASTGARALVISSTEIPLRLPTGENLESAAVRSAQFQSGRLWLLAVKEDLFSMNTQLGSKAAFVSVDLTSGHREIVWVPAEYGATHSSFGVMDDAFYTTSANRVLRYGFQEKRWESIPAPIEDRARITLLDGRFYITTPDSLLQFDPKTRLVQILSSSRRRPAQNALDLADWRGSPGSGAIPRLDSPEVFRAPGGSIGLVVNRGLFVRPLDQQEWSEVKLPVFRGAWNVWPVVGEGRVLMEVNGAQTRARILEYYSDSGKLVELAEHRFPADIRDPRADRVLGPPQYLWPKGIGLHGAFTVADSNALWVLAPEQWWQRGGSGTEAPLLRFEPGVRSPMILRFRFERDGKPVSDLIPMGAQGTKYLVLLNSPAGVMVANFGSRHGNISYWLIPRSRLDRELEMLRPAARADEAVKQAYYQRMRDKFDANHNGAVESDELNRMHLDPECLEYDRAEIDQDDNCVLDVEELPWFDVNNNGVIEKAEREAIRRFHAILAARALEKFGRDHRLGSEQWRASFRNDEFAKFDKNNDGALDAAEVADFLENRFDGLKLAAYDYAIESDR